MKKLKTQEIPEQGTEPERRTEPVHSSKLSTKKCSVQTSIYNVQQRTSLFTNDSLHDSIIVDILLPINEMFDKINCEWWWQSHKKLEQLWHFQCWPLKGQGWKMYNMDIPLLQSFWNYHLNLSGADLSIFVREADVWKRRIGIEMKGVKTEVRRKEIWKIVDQIRAGQGTENCYNHRSIKERGDREPEWDWSGWTNEPSV